MPADAAPQELPLLLWLKKHYRVSLVLIISYVLFAWLSETFLPHPSTLFPSSAIALGALFFTGLELWPAVYIAAFITSLLAGAPLVFLVMSPVAQTLQAVLGAYLLRKARIDPLFRTSRDVFFLLGVVILVSFIVPTFTSLANVISSHLLSVSYPVPAWNLRYTGTLFCLLILTPFLLRWLAKPKFNRTGKEIVELVAVFAFLIGVNSLIFIGGIPTLEGIPLVYFLLVPLFWIALRLRPRFVSLALLITSGFAIVSLYIGTAMPAPDLFTTRLFQTEEFLIVIATMFLIVVSLEENRRLNANLLRSQLSTLENALARISSESNAKNDFIAVLAHELRNPLAPVVSGIDLLKLKEGREQEELETLVMMEDRMQVVRRLLDDLLDISRITEGKIALKKERMDLEVVIRRAILSTHHVFQERHQSVVFNPPKEPFWIEGDPVRIEQVFSNLLTNASKYSDSGDKTTITMGKKDGNVEIVVTDSGIGIASHALEDIFTPFHQISLGSRSKKGLGIGLALVRSFIEMHNGSVVATSKGPGLGSQFKILLPLMHGEKPPHPEQTLGQGVLAATKSNCPRILIVDDIEAVAHGIGKLLEIKGCSVAYAHTGGEAIEKAERFSPEVILLDVGLPDLDGYTVAKTLRARGFRGKLVALTGYSTLEAKEKGKEAGFEQYLVKPAGLAELKRVIPELA